MYVTSAMVGMYMSGLLGSSRGGRYSVEPAAAAGSAECRCCRDHGLCHQGNRMMRSLERT